MSSFDLLVILLDFHVHVWQPLSRRAHLKGSPEKKAHQQRTFFFGGGAEIRSPCSRGPVVEGLKKLIERNERMD